MIVRLRFERYRIPLVKVSLEFKALDPEFTWEREDYMKSKYPQLFVDCAVEPTSEYRDDKKAVEEGETSAMPYATGDSGGEGNMDLLRDDDGNNDGGGEDGGAGDGDRWANDG
ncbi:hypothetical protein Tco_0575207 [Tanacetum coccineum]